MEDKNDPTVNEKWLLQMQNGVFCDKIYFINDLK
jgi:hypothetical protein